jgi:hypothetical protein
VCFEECIGFQREGEASPREGGREGGREGETASARWEGGREGETASAHVAAIYAAAAAAAPAADQVSTRKQ